MLVKSLRMIFGYNTSDLSSVGTACPSPTVGDSGVRRGRQSGSSLVADIGNIYFMTGNGSDPLHLLHLSPTGPIVFIALADVGLHRGKSRPKLVHQQRRWISDLGVPAWSFPTNGLYI
jgi:hypothetical protein